METEEGEAHEERREGKLWSICKIIENKKLLNKFFKKNEFFINFIND